MLRLWSALGLLTFGYTAAQAAPAGAELAEMPNEQLLNVNVSSASKFTQKISEAPSAVAVVTAAEIKAFGWRTLADILRSMRGLYVSNDRNYTYLGARGFLRSADYNAQFLLMIDGARVNDSVYGQGLIGNEFPLDVDMIERVEFVPGPGSSIYGANAFFGVVNVISKRGRDAIGTQFSAAGGSTEAGKARVSYGWRGAEGEELLLSASSFSTRGKDLYFAEFDSPLSNNGMASHLDYERGQNLFARAAWGNFQFEFARVERSKGIPTASFAQTFNDPRSRTFDAQTLFDVQYHAQIAQQTELSSRLHWARSDYEGWYAYAPGMLADGSRAGRVSGEFKLASNRVENHKLIAGLELQRDYDTDQFYYSVPATQSPAPFLDEHDDGHSGVYLQDEITLRDDLLLNVGLRYDQGSVMHGQLNPRIALIYKLTPATSVKALYGTAYRVPSAFEMYYKIDGPGGQKTNPDLVAERIKSTELVFEHRVGLDTRFMASLFRNSVKDLITPFTDPIDGLLVFRNLDSASARGIEFEIEHAWDNGARLRASLSGQRTVDGSTGRQLGNSPQQLAKLNFAGPLLSGALRGAVEAQYVGRRLTLQGQTGGYWLANLNFFSTRIAQGLEVSSGIYNVFDRRYADPGAAEHTQDAIIQDGRSVRVKFQYTF